MRRIVHALTGAVFVAIGACGTEHPCDAYVDYMCACHADDTGLSCDELALTYAEADADVQNECALLLGEQERLDADAGEVCTESTAGPTGTTAG